MKQLRGSWMAVALLYVAACADFSGDEGPHRDCFRKTVETRSAQQGGHAAPTLGPAPTLKPAATRVAPARASAAHDPSSDAGCDDPGHTEQHEQFWDGTGRTEAVRGT